MLDESKVETTVVTFPVNEGIPGTVHLVDVHNTELHKDGEVVLIPKPSEDPDDPLNWSRLRKLVNISLVFLYTFATGVGGTSTYSILVPISEDTGITLAQLVNGTGYLFLLAGWGNIIWQPFALTFGRRPTYLLSILGCLAMSEWAAHIGSYGQWAACRCLFGLMVAPVEVLPELCVAELFFAHERGTFVGLYMLVLAVSNYLAPLIAGFINNTYGWQWVQHWAALLLALNFVLSFFFYEDTMYQRSMAEVDEVESQKGGKEIHWAAVTLKTRYINMDIKKKSYFAKLKLWYNNPQNVSFGQFIIMAVRPVYIFFGFPAIAFSGMFYGWALVWYNVYNATASSILSSPPYNFDSLQVGLTYIAPSIGALLGGLYSGPLTDWFMIRLAKRNNGVREPEQRLWGLSAYCIIIIGGLILWGVGAAHEIPWGGILVGGAMVSFCNVLGGAYSIAYAVDSYKDISGESLVSVVLCRNTLSFALNYAITPWINHSGLQSTFIVASILGLLFGLTFLLMTWKGKALRKSSAERYWNLVSTQIIGGHR